MKRVFCIALAAFLSLSLASCGAKDNTDIAVYERFAAENGVMPELDALGEYESIFPCTTAMRISSAGNPIR